MIDPKIRPLTSENASGRTLELIHAAQRHAPDEREMTALMARLDAIESAPAALGLGLAKVLALVTALVLVTGGIGWHFGGSSAEHSAVAQATAPVHAPTRVFAPTPVFAQTPVFAPTPAIQAIPAIKTIPVSEAPPLASALKHSVEKRAGASAVPTEVELFARARQALMDQEWRQVLRATTTHERYHPVGVLSEEREAVAVEALIRSEQLSRARVRLRALEQKFPASSYGPALERLLANGPS